MNWNIAAVAVAILVASIVLRRLGLIGARQACEGLKQGARVIDVRTAQEYRDSHLPEALNIPLNELKERIARHAPDKAAMLLLHCRSGGRSGMGCRMLRQLGYCNVHNLGAYDRARRLLRATRA